MYAGPFVQILCTVENRIISTQRGPRSLSDFCLCHPPLKNFLNVSTRRNREQEKIGEEKSLRHGHILLLRH